MHITLFYSILVQLIFASSAAYSSFNLFVALWDNFVPTTYFHQLYRLKFICLIFNQTLKDKSLMLFNMSFGKIKKKLNRYIAKPLPRQTNSLTEQHQRSINFKFTGDKQKIWLNGFLRNANLYQQNCFKEKNNQNN